MTITKSPLQQRIDTIFGLYEINGSDEYAGESVSILEHSFQTAQLARQEGHDDEVILGAFLHDIGHFLPNKNEMDGLGNISHEVAGADFLQENGFSERIVSLVKNHVEAKRYLTFKYPEYYEKLSEASKRTLTFQGGRMNPSEAKIFEEKPPFTLFLKMREWDDQAKNVELNHTDLNYYRALSASHLSERV